jgi:hypothetical protein
MTVEEGRQCCYVLGADSPERRWISTRHATTDLLEVAVGLKAGERVVVDPAKLPRKAKTSGNALAAASGRRQMFEA